MSEVKKIVFLADCLVTQKAGIHFFAKQFIQRIIKQYPDNQYHILLPHPYGQLDVEEIIVPSRTAVPFHFRLRSFFDIPKAVKKIKPDLVVEMAHFGPFGLPSGIKKATVIHDLTPILFPEWHDQMSTAMHNLLLPGILKRADHIIVNSKKTKDDLVEYRTSTEQRISVAYPAINPLSESQNDTIAPAPKATTKSNLSKEKYLLSVGTIEPRKNYMTLIKAFDKLCTKYPDLHLRIVGYKGWRSKPFFELLERSSFTNRIILEGYTSDARLDDLYKNALAFVFPSLYEGFGMPVLEALSYGLPLVVSDIPTSKEICSDAALYFDKENDSELLEQIIRLMEDPELLKSYKQKSLDRFSEFNTSRLPLDHIFS